MGVHRNCKHDLDPYASRVISITAYQLIRRPEFTESDREDIEQELWLDLLQRLSRFNGDRARHETFVNLVVNHKVASLIETRQAGKRDHRIPMYSLDEEIVNPDGDPIQPDAIALCEALQEMPRPSDLAMDLDRAIHQLPHHLQLLAKRLSRENIAEISRATGVPRSTLNDQVRKLRKLLEDHHLREYLD